MANRKREVYKPKPMTEGKRNLIQGLLQEYDIQSADDIQNALKDLLSGTIQDMLETEMDNHLGYDRYERSGEPNYRNGTKAKTVRSKYGEFEVDVPQDRQSSFEPQVLPKRQKDISSIDDKIISMYAKGMTTRQISETIEDIYGFEVSEGMVSDITDKLLPRIEEWQNRPLSPVYPIVFIDAVHFSVRDDGVIRKQLKTVTEKWSGQYPSAMNRWHDNWDVVSPIFKFSKEVRTAFYTTNAIESLNSCYRRLNKQRSVFPSSQALMKALYLGTFEVAKKWTIPIRNWGKVCGELEIMYPDRMLIQQ